jgi:Na+/H+ antiporter
LPQIEIIVGLMVAVAALATLATRIKVPYPILLVIGGSVLGFMPGLPKVKLDPELVFLLFLPPLLYVSAIFTSWRDFRANIRPITFLAVGLVLMTTFVVGAVVHAVAGLPWAAAFVLGAIVSPTDAIAATAVAQRLGVPRRIVTILEGESLVNDATGIVAYRVAVAAVITGAFSMWEAGLQFVVGAIGGVAVGLAVGWLVIWTRRHISEDPSIQNIVSLLTPFVAYLAAEELPHGMWVGLHGLVGTPTDLHFSGVLAVVTTGLYIGRRSPSVTSSSTRLQGFGTWQLISFLLNGLIFILIGLQLDRVVSNLERSVGELILYAVLVSVAVIVVRMIWVFPATYVPRWVSRSLVAERLHHLLDGNAGCDLAGGGPRPSFRDGLGGTVPRTRPHNFPDVLGDPGHARGAGTLTATIDKGPWPGGRPHRGEGGEQGSHQSGRRRAAAPG